jgi:hypothetical protein
MKRMAMHQDQAEEKNKSVMNSELKLVAFYV